MTDKEEAIETFAKEHDMDVERVREVFEEELEATREWLTEGLDLDPVDLTLKRLRSNGISENRTTGGTDDVSPVAIVALGCTRPPWGDDEDVVAYAVVKPEGEKAGLAYIDCREETGVDTGHIVEAFSKPLNVLRGWFQVWEDNDVTLDNGKEQRRTFYRGKATGKTKVEEVSPDEVPDDDPISKLPTGLQDRLTMVQDNFVPDSVALSSIGASVPNNDEMEFVDSMLNVKRFTGQVVDYYQNGDFGKYVIIDESVAPDDVSDGALMNDGQRVPGLQVYLEPEMIEHGVDSRLEVIGRLYANDDGKISMSGVGVVPLLSTPMDDGDGGGDADGVDSESIA